MKNNKGKWIGLAVAAIALGVIGFTNVDARDHHHHRRHHHDGGRVAVEIVRAVLAPLTPAPRIVVAPPPPPPRVVIHHHRRPAPPPPRRHHGGRGRR